MRSFPALLLALTIALVFIRPNADGNVSTNLAPELPYRIDSPAMPAGPTRPWPDRSFGCPAYRCRTRAPFPRWVSTEVTFDTRLQAALNGWDKWPVVWSEEDRADGVVPFWAGPLHAADPKSELLRALLSRQGESRMGDRHLEVESVLPQWVEAARWLRRVLRSDSADRGMANTTKASRGGIGLTGRPQDDGISFFLAEERFVNAFQSKTQITFWMELPDQCEPDADGHLGAALLFANEFLALPFEICSPPAPWRKLISTNSLVYAKLDIKQPKAWYETMTVASDGHSAAITFLKIDPGNPDAPIQLDDQGDPLPRGRAVWFPANAKFVKERWLPTEAMMDGR